MKKERTLKRSTRLRDRLELEDEKNSYLQKLPWYWSPEQGLWLHRYNDAEKLLAEVDTYVPDVGNPTRDEIKQILIKKHNTAHNEHQKRANKANADRKLEEERKRVLKKLKALSWKTVKRYYNEWTWPQKERYQNNKEALEIEINRLYDARSKGLLHIPCTQALLQSYSNIIHLQTTDFKYDDMRTMHPIEKKIRQNWDRLIKREICHPHSKF